MVTDTLLVAADGLEHFTRQHLVKRRGVRRTFTDLEIIERLRALPQDKIISQKRMFADLGDYADKDANRQRPPKRARIASGEDENTSTISLHIEAPAACGDDGSGLDDDNAELICPINDEKIARDGLTTDLATHLTLGICEPGLEVEEREDVEADNDRRDDKDKNTTHEEVLDREDSNKNDDGDEIHVVDGVEEDVVDGVEEDVGGSDEADVGDGNEEDVGGSDEEDELTRRIHLRNEYSPRPGEHSRYSRISTSPAVVEDAEEAEDQSVRDFEYETFGGSSPISSADGDEPHTAFQASQTQDQFMSPAASFQMPPLQLFEPIMTSPPQSSPRIEDLGGQDSLLPQLQDCHSFTLRPAGWPAVHVAHTAPALPQMRQAPAFDHTDWPSAGPVPPQSQQASVEWHDETVSPQLSKFGMDVLAFLRPYLTAHIDVTDGGAHALFDAWAHICQQRQLAPNQQQPVRMQQEPVQAVQQPASQQEPTQALEGPIPRQEPVQTLQKPVRTEKNPELVQTQRSGPRQKIRSSSQVARLRLTERIKKELIRIRAQRTRMQANSAHWISVKSAANACGVSARAERTRLSRIAQFIQLLNFAPGADDGHARIAPGVLDAAVYPELHGEKSLAYRRREKLIGGNVFTDERQRAECDAAVSRASKELDKEEMSFLSGKTRLKLRRAVSVEEARFIKSGWSVETVWVRDCVTNTYKDAENDDDDENEVRPPRRQVLALVFRTAVLPLGGDEPSSVPVETGGMEKSDLAPIVRDRDLNDIDLLECITYFGVPM
ncbi:hypothetical protein DFH11DRAFT_98476 [Phellopilus nigrolimitatus]|nr:hypothetical protein DFH11DRAFT_98476 [Phellopilus nigrolimitatus]